MRVGREGGPFVGPVLLMVVLYVAFQGAAQLFFIESKVHKLRASNLIGQSALAVTGEPAESVLHVEHVSGDEEVGTEESHGHGMTEEFPMWQADPALKVFMYDLPREFTYGVIEQYLRSRGLFKDDGEPVDDAQLQYPGNQHSAEWHLFSDLLKPTTSKTNPVAMRVNNPSEADVFYVPFFSSLSLLVNMVPNPQKSTYSDEQMQEKLVAWLEQQPTWQKANGRDHVIIAQDPNALYKVKDRLKRAVLLISDFGRMVHGEGSLVKDVILPYTHRITSYEYENATLTRDTLLFFMGNRYRKEGGKIRDELFQLLEGESDMFIRHGTQSRESRRVATQGMRTSKFCLHPAGDTPSACRLFDAIVSICVPVIVSDDIELPFEDQIDYSQFSIFVPTSKALKSGYLAHRLRNVNSERLIKYQQRMREVRKYFEYDVPDGAINQIWRQIHNKIPLIKLMVHRDKRIVTGIERGEDCSCICSNGSAPHVSI